MSKYRFYAVFVPEDTGEWEPFKFSCNYQFAQACCSAGEAGGELLRVNKAELTKEQVEYAVYCETDNDFREHFGLEAWRE